MPIIYTMKKRNLLSLFTAFSFLFAVSCQSQEQKDDEQSIKMLQQFYKSYITLFLAEISDANTASTRAIEEKYCSAELLQEIDRQTETQDLDHDPFLNAQDAIPEMLTTLSIVKDKTKPHMYQVSYEYNKEKTTMILKVEKEGGFYKITDIPAIR